MAAVWVWGVRNPALLALALCFAAGYEGVLDWSAALAATLPCAFIAQGAGWLAGRARRRADRRRALAGSRQGKVVPFGASRGEERRRAA